MPQLLLQAVVARLLDQGFERGHVVAGQAERGAEELGGALALVGSLALLQDLLAPRAGHPDSLGRGWSRGRGRGRAGEEGFRYQGPRDNPHRGRSCNTSRGVLGTWRGVINALQLRAGNILHNT